MKDTPPPTYLCCIARLTSQNPQTDFSNLEWLPKLSLFHSISFNHPLKIFTSIRERKKIISKFVNFN